MSKDEAKAEVARLLLERAEMKRLGTDLSPDKLMLLKRLMYRLGMNNVKLQRREALLRLARRIGVKRYAEPVDPTQPVPPSGPLAPWRNPAPQPSAPKKTTKALQTLREKAALVPVTDEPLPQVPRPANTNRSPSRRRQVDESVRNVPGGFDIHTRSGRRAFRDYLSDTGEDRDLEGRVEQEVQYQVEHYEPEIDQERLREAAEGNDWTPEVMLQTIREHHPEAAEAVDQWHRYNSYRPVAQESPSLFDPHEYGWSNTGRSEWHDELADPESTAFEDSLSHHLRAYHPDLDHRAINNTLNWLTRDRRSDMESARDDLYDQDRRWYQENMDTSDIENDILERMHDEMEQEGRWEERDEEPEEDEDEDGEQTPQLNVVNSNEPPQQLPTAEPKPITGGPQFGRWYGDSRVHTYRFQTPSGRPFTIDIGHYNEGNTKIDNLTFNDDRHSFDDTGKGEAAAVFDQVAQAVTAYMQAKKPHVLTFSAATTDGQATGGKSRQNLYTSLIKRIGQIDPNYAAAAIPSPGGGKNFVVFDRTKVDEVERLIQSKFSGRGGPALEPIILSRRRSLLARLARRMGVRRYAMAKKASGDSLPEYLRFTNLGAALRKHAHTGNDEAAHIAQTVIGTDDLTPLSILRDYLNDNPDHPLAKQFYWDDLPKKVQLDRDLKQYVDSIHQPANGRYGDPAMGLMMHRSYLYSDIARGSDPANSGASRQDRSRATDPFTVLNNAVNGLVGMGYTTRTPGPKQITHDDVAQSAARLRNQHDRLNAQEYLRRSNDPTHQSPEHYSDQWHDAAEPYLDSTRMNHPERFNRGKPVRYAKLDGHVTAHPLVQGFPIETALRHLANDPNNHPAIRELAKVAVTGGKEGDGSNIPMALWALHDELHQHKHPAKDWYNWMSAADKIGLDAHTGKALQEEAERTRYHASTSADDPNRNPWTLTPEHHATEASLMIGNKARKDTLGSWYDQRREGIRDRVVNRVKQLSGNQDDDAIHESIRRHAYRANGVWRRSLGVENGDTEGEARVQSRDIGPFVDRTPKGVPQNHHATHNEKATRYRRILRRLARRTGVKRYAFPVTADHTTPSGIEIKHLKTGGAIGIDGKPTTVHQYRVNAPNAKPLSVILEHRPEAEDAFVHWVGTDDGLKSGQNTIGLRGMREVQQAIRLRHPEVKSLSGVRVGRREQAKVNLKLARKPSGTEGLKRYKMVAGDFLDALQRIRSSDQHAIRKTTEEIAAKLGLKPASTVDALHNSPAYSVPGVAQAIYANASPESIHAAAAWYGLTGNIPGMAVFHVRPDGPDMLHRFRMQGSGHDMLQKLDKAGITDRVLVPHRKGFDLLIPDRGGKLRDRVSDFTRRQKTELQSSRGHFKLIGAADQAKAREMFRNTITKQEQKAV